MPALDDKSNQTAAVTDLLNLPAQVPDLPDDLLTRFPSMSDWQENLAFWYRGVVSPLQDLATDTNDQAFFFFDAENQVVKLAGVLTIDAANRSIYIGAGNFGKADTPFYVDSLGRFSLMGTFIWDGSTDTPTLTLKDAIIDVGTKGSIEGGATDYLTGVGFFLGYSATAMAYQFSVGDPNGAYVAWDGTNLTIAGGIIVYSVATVSLSPAGQLFTPNVTVMATCANGAATIRYTTDGSDVTASSPVFPGGGLLVSSTTTIKARAFVGTLGSSQVVQTYTLNTTTSKVGTPSIHFSPESFTSFSPTSTCFITAPAGATIQYSVNGGAFGLYAGSFLVHQLDQVQAYAQLGGFTDSDITGRDYENNV